MYQASSLNLNFLLITLERNVHQSEFLEMFSDAIDNCYLRIKSFKKCARHNFDIPEQ